MSLAAAESIAITCPPRRAVSGAIATAAAVLANLALTYGITHTSVLWKWSLDTTILGVALGQLVLLAIWLALGSMSTFWRLLLVSLVGIAGSRAANLAVGKDGWEDFVLRAGGCLLFVLAFHALLVPKRWLGRWRLGFQLLNNPAPDAKGMQVNIRHLIAWTIWCILPCALARAIAGEQAIEAILGVALFGAFGFPLAITTSLLILGRRKLLWLIACAATWGFSTGLKQLIPDMFDTPRMWEFNLAVVVTVSINLTLLRLCGLRMWRAQATDRFRAENSATWAAP